MSTNPHRATPERAAADSMDDDQTRPDLLRRLSAETRLADTSTRGGSLSELVHVVSDELSAVTYLLTPEERIVARAVPDGVTRAPIPRLGRLLDAVGPSDPPRCASVVSLPSGVATDPVVLAPVSDEDRVHVWLVVALEPDDMDTGLWVVERAVVHLRGAYLAQRRLARVAWNARANLGRQMIRGSSYDADLRACAEYLGVDVDADRIVVFVLERGRPSGSAIDAERLSDHVVDELGVEVLAIRGSEGVLLAVTVATDCDHVDLIARIKGAVVRGLEAMGDEFAVAGLSSVTRSGQLRRAYREARETARCLDRYASRSARAIACDELGPARLFVANSDEHAVRMFVRDVLGPLLTGKASTVTLLRTLQAYFENGRSIRETAGALRVHENTIRHRLGKVHDLTGLDVASTSNDQLSVHTALLVLRLQGHHAVPEFDRGTAPAGAG